MKYFRILISSTNPKYCSKHPLVGPPIAHAHFAVDDRVCQGVDKRYHSCEKHHKLARPPVCCQGYDVGDLKRKAFRKKTPFMVLGARGGGWRGEGDSFKKYSFKFGLRKLSFHLLHIFHLCCSAMQEVFCLLSGAHPREPPYGF